MARYELLVSLHILAVAVWVGSATIYLILHQYLHAKVSRAEMFAVLHHTDRVAPFVFLPSIILTLTAGILLVVTEEAWSFSDLWVSLGLGGLLTAFVLGFISGVPMAASLARLEGSVGLEAPEVTEASRRILLVSYVELVVLVSVVAVMVWKPGS